MEGTVQARLFKALEQYKSKTAIEYGFDVMTYEELGKRSNFIANYIINSKIEAGSFIALLVEDRINLASFIMGILKAGCVFVPLDSSYPAIRLENMINIADVKYIFIDEGYLDYILKDNDDIEKLVVNDEFFNKNEIGTGRPEVEYTPEDKIYAYFTSGTTGDPKAIVGKNKSLLHFINWEIETFNVDENYNISQFTTPCHDPWLRDVLVALFSGGKVCIPESKEIMLESASLVNWIELSEISLIHCTPSLFRHFNTNTLNKNDFLNLKFILMAGERINPAELASWYNIFGERIQLVNLYGPTETTMVKTYHLIQPSDVELASIPVGKPMKGTRIIILDDEMNLCAQGDQGEIYIRTPYMTYGYYNNTELNKQKFMKNPFSNNHGDIIYRTGDLGRILPEGNVEFLGRIDRQIKIRGIRVELGEIENLIVRYERTKEAVVVEKQFANGDSFLCAYVVENVSNKREMGKAALEQDLRSYLHERLPIYMIPAYIVILDNIPLTPNRKINYKALPEPEECIKNKYIAPQDEIEKIVVELCSEILGKEKIGINDNFMQIGGHSLNVMTLVSRIYQELGVELSLGQVFSDASIKAIAGYIKESSNGTYMSIQKVEENFDGIYSVSPAQRRQFLLREIEGEQTNYNITDAKLIEGPLCRERLEQAYKTLIQRHESFRTSFKIIDGNIYQCIADDVDTNLQYIEVNFSDEQERCKSARIIIGQFIKPFDLSKAALIRVLLIKIGELKHILAYDMHHIIADETSVDIFTRELILLYNGEELPELKVQYKDFSAWQNNILQSEEIKKQEQYWLEVFGDYEEISVLNMPTDFPRQKVQNFEGNLIKFEIDELLTDGLNNLALSKGATLYIVMLSILNVVLHKYTGQEDIIIGSPIAGRVHCDLENVVGMFVNTLPMRNFPKGSYNFREFMETVKANSFKAYENQEYQFEELASKLNLKRDLSRGALFDVMFILHNMYGRVVENNNIKYSPFSFEKTTSKLDMTISAVEQNGKIEVELEYCTKLFKQETIDRFICHFMNIIQSVLNNPDQKLGEMDILSEEERNMLLLEFNRTTVAYDKEKTLQALFEQQVDLHPDMVAIEDKDESITYWELNIKVNKLARYLRSKGACPGSVIAIAIKRSIDMIVGILAVLKSGAAYIPIDTTFPQQRIKYILEDSNASIILTDFKSREHLELSNGLKKELIEINWKILNELDSENIENLNTADDLAYIIYTSGSTGNPKGVMIEHKAVNNFIKGMTDEIKFTPRKSILALTSISFDIFVLETLLPLISGLKIVVADEEAQTNPKVLSKLILKSGVKILQATPTRMQILLEGAGDLSFLQKLEAILLGGEALPESVASKLKGEIRARIYNVYGPTETTVWSSLKELTFEENITIGKPIANTRMYICNSYNKLQPIGVPGEICIAGDGLARGYYNHTELTSGKFVSDICYPDEKMYKTGDIGLWTSEGEIQYIGRSDNQVKIRGYRIELEEIESQLLRHPLIKEAVVLHCGNKNENKFLYAYFVSEVDIDSIELKEHLSKKLPYYMIPSSFVKIKSIPTTLNGKIDRKALEGLRTEAYQIQEHTVPTTETEKKLATIWKDVLGVQEVGLEDNFFSLGGNSLTAIKLEVDMERHGMKVETSDIFENQTLNEFVRFVQNHNALKEEKKREIKKNKTNIEERESNDYKNSINNIEPFNEFLYKTCFYNAAFPAVLHLGKDINSFLINDVPVYTYDNKLQLGINYLAQNTLEDTLMYDGVCIEKKYKVDDIVYSIIEAINSGRPVVMGVDCFYESIKSDLYQKEHWQHYLLVYGYDIYKNIFNIIEHVNSNSLTYEKRTITFKDLIEASEGYLKYFKQESDAIIYEFFLAEDSLGTISEPRDDSLLFEEIYTSNVYNCQNSVEDGFERFNLFRKDFKSIALSEKDLFENADIVIKGFNDIVNARKVEFYKISKICKKDVGIINLVQSILDNWIYVRNIIVKYMYSKVYNRVQLEKCIDKLNLIYNLEYEYNQRIALNGSKVLAKVRRK